MYKRQVQIRDLSLNQAPVVLKPELITQINDSITIKIQAEDPENDSIYIRISWGNGDTTNWFIYDSSEYEYKYKEVGTYEVKAQAKDVYQAVSNWSEPLVITLVGIDKKQEELKKFSLSQNYPNPFNSQTTIEYNLPEKSKEVVLEVYDISGKRIKRLCDLSKKFGIKPVFDFEKMEKNVAKIKLYKTFAKDLFFNYLPPFVLILAIGMSVIMLLYKIRFNFLPLLFILLGFSIYIKTRYRYSISALKDSSVIKLMSNVYASPIRGEPVVLKGKIIGRGIPGYIFSEDMMFQDDTGIIYLNYESLFPFLGNLYFAWRKVNELIGKEVKIKGWFLRSITSRIELKSIEYKGMVIKGRVREINLLISAVFVLLGLLIFLF